MERSLLSCNQCWSIYHQSQVSLPLFKEVHVLIFSLFYNFYDRDNPLKLASDSIKTDINLVKRLPFVFNVPLSKIIELITDRYIEENKVDEALVLCNKFKVSYYLSFGMRPGLLRLSEMDKEGWDLFYRKERRIKVRQESDIPR